MLEWLTLRPIGRKGSHQSPKNILPANVAPTVSTDPAELYFADDDDEFP